MNLENEQPQKYIFQGVKPLLRRTIDRFETFKNGADNQGYLTGIPTGLIDLDKVTGGIHRGITVLGGENECGLTDFSLGLAVSAARVKKSVLYFSFNQLPENLMDRILCARSFVSLKNAREGYLAERDFPKMTGAAAAIAELHGWLNFSTFGAGDPMKVYNQCAQKKGENGLDMVVINTFQDIFPSTGMGGNSEYQNARETADVLKSISTNLESSVVVVSSLKKGREKDQRLTVGDLRDFGTLENASPVLLFQKAKDSQEDEGEFEIEAIPVNVYVRNNYVGGVDCTVNLTYFRNHAKFELASRIVDVPSD